MKHEFYFGIFRAYEDYYAIGETEQEVKTLLWRMYSYNFYGKPAKENKRIFEEEVYIKKVAGVQGFGYNTKFGASYTIKNNRLTNTNKL
jgi:hypothetical protein